MTKKAEEQFLAELAKGIPVIHAAQSAGVARNTLYKRRKSSKKFAAAWDDALEDGRLQLVDKLEQEADRRAMEGVTTGVFLYKDKVFPKKRFSDTLLLARLRALDPERYADRSKVEHGGRVGNEHSGPGGGPIQVEIDWVDADHETETSEEA